MFAVIDIETTGLDAQRHRITEIAVVHCDGNKITRRFVSLLNPDCVIPEFITKLTGINNGTVATSPRFHEVAARLHEETEGCTLVGHNVRFDYGFVRAEYA